MSNDRSHPGRPPRVSAFGDAPLYFITFNAHERQHLLANDRTHQRFADFGKGAAAKGAAIGQYVLMPDHVHLFLRCDRSLKIGDTVRMLKRSLSASIEQAVPHWQPGFFDHILRKSESYAEKWHYVRQNPVRAGLVEKADDWVFKGEICDLRM